MTFKVVHFKKERYDVYVGRPSKYGNPFSTKENSLARFKVNTSFEAIQKYYLWIIAQPDLLLDIKQNLKGKILGCWCGPKRCHADVLIVLANDLDIESQYWFPKKNTNSLFN